jgi:hypothetical protein
VNAPEKRRSPRGSGPSAQSTQASFDHSASAPLWVVCDRTTDDHKLRILAEFDNEASARRHCAMLAWAGVAGLALLVTAVREP